MTRTFNDSDPIIENASGGKQSATTTAYHLIPPLPVKLVAETLAYGAARYGANNWQLIPESDHLNHAIGHIFEYLSGNEDEQHLAHALCRLMFAASGQLRTE
jgi:Domain of unknown function (DUF5664)